MTLSEATRISTHIIDSLRAYSHRIEVAGSIRRSIPTVNDIDIVVIPQHYPSFRDRVLLRDPEILRDGQDILSIRIATGQQVDFFFAHPTEDTLFGPLPSNYGSILLCRTGSPSHNIRLIERAKSLGLRWNPHHGVFTAEEQCIASAEELDIFAALQLPYIAPQERV